MTNNAITPLRSRNCYTHSEIDILIFIRMSFFLIGGRILKSYIQYHTSMILYDDLNLLLINLLSCALVDICELGRIKVSGILSDVSGNTAIDVNNLSVDEI